MRQIQRDLYAKLRADVLVAQKRIADAVRPLSAEQLHQHPEPKGWSIGEVLEHLCVSDEGYDAPLGGLLRSSRPDAGAPAREWKSSFIGNFIARTLEKPRPIKAPKVFRPGATPRNAVVEKLLSREAAFVKTMDDAQSLDWNRLKIGSPALPGWAPKLNLGDAFRIHVVHLNRHAGQIERVAGKL